MNGPDWGGIGAWLVGGGGLVAGLRLLWPLLAKRLRRAGAAALSDDATDKADETMLSSGAAMMTSSVAFIQELQTQMRTLAGRVDALEAENALLRAELREVTRMADYRQARIDQLEQTVASQHGEITRLEAEVATLRAERTERMNKEGTQHG